MNSKHQESYFFFKRNHFTTRLPKKHFFSASHHWLKPLNNDNTSFQVGLTQFSLRMLGEIVEFEVEAELNSSVEEGSTIGWIEGFKAISDLYLPATGSITKINTELMKATQCFKSSIYDEAWLYEIQLVDHDSFNKFLSFQDYADLLNQTIDKMLEENPNAYS